MIIVVVVLFLVIVIISPGFEEFEIIIIIITVYNWGLIVCMYVCMYVCIFAIRKLFKLSLQHQDFHFPFTNYTIIAMHPSSFVFVNRKMEITLQALIEINRFKF